MLLGRWWSPNFFTFLTLLFGLASAVLLAVHELGWALVTVIISGLMDVVDGAVAKATNRSSIFGGVFDSVTDRITETALYAGFLIGYPQLQLSSFLAVISFLLSSYTFERIMEEGKVPPGFILLERKERFLLILIGILLLPINIEYVSYILLFISAWSFFTIFSMLNAARSLFT